MSPLRLRVTPTGQALRGRVQVPADKSIAHRAFLLAALATGVSEVRASRVGEDVRRTIDVLRALGVGIESAEDGSYRVRGVGLFGLRRPEAALDVGESGTTARLMLGLLSAQEFPWELTGQGSLLGRPMGRVCVPLASRGARLPNDTSVQLPLRSTGMPEGEPLGLLHYAMPVASAQVKGALLLSGLYAHGNTVLREPVVSRDHTERMMCALGIPVRGLGDTLALEPGGWSGKLSDFKMATPGDASSAFALLAASLMVPGSAVEVADVCINPTRTGALDLLRAAGVMPVVEPHGEALGEPFGDVGVMGVPGFGGFAIRGELLVRAIDEVPVLLALAAKANGVTRLSDAAELRLKESDRIARMAEVLRAFGVEVQDDANGLQVQGRAGLLRAARVNAHGDHRIAMAATLLALAADGPSQIDGAEALRKSYPGFVSALTSLGATITLDQVSDSS